MTTIKLITLINAPASRCFDLARSIDIHLLSMNKTKERAIAGRTSGLAEKGDTITWEAVHFGIRQQLTSKITYMNAPISFTDEMVKGAFKSMVHEHFFEDNQSYTVMTDHFIYEAPFGLLGKLFSWLILDSYMIRFLKIRNAAIKKVAESDEWGKFL